MMDKKYRKASEQLADALRTYARITRTANVEKFTQEALAAVDEVLDGFGTIEDAEEEERMKER